MTKTVSAIISAAVEQDTTTPVYLIDMGWDVSSPDVNRLICTWGADITWNSLTWAASGAAVKGLSVERGQLTLPNGDGDPWLALVNSQLARDRNIDIYEHHTSTDSPSGSDAVLLFSGRMDGVIVEGINISINLLNGRANKAFPVGGLGPPSYNYLLPVGTKLYFQNEIVTVN
ncbi:hypothetical protein N9937_01145 [bacterium]|nr:hypothetical protein [bacterium]